MMLPRKSISVPREWCFYYLVKTHSPSLHSLGMLKNCVAAKGALRFSCVVPFGAAHFFVGGMSMDWNILRSAVALLFSMYSFFKTKQIERITRETQKIKINRTIDSYGVLQDKVLDELNSFERNRVREIAERPEATENANDYKKLSGMMARLESFSLAVNSEIYDIETVNRLAGTYLMGLFDKIEPVIQKKRSLNTTEKHYKQTEIMINTIKLKHRKETKK